MQIIWKGKYKDLEKTGIYGIYRNNTLVYIGKTSTSFARRKQEHSKNITKEDQSLYLYRYINKFQKSVIDMRPLLIREYIRSSRKITDQDLYLIELACISLFRPKCNIAGVSKDFILPK